MDGGTFPSHTKNIPSLAVLFSPIIRKLSLFILYGVSLENCADRFMNMAVFFVLLPPPLFPPFRFKICLDSVGGGCKMYEVLYGMVCVRMRVYAYVCVHVFG